MSKEIATPALVSSFPVVGLLGAVLVVLKVMGKITLAWKWVLAPFWMPFALGCGIVGLMCVLAIIAGVIAAFVD